MLAPYRKLGTWKRKKKRSGNASHLHLLAPQQVKRIFTYARVVGFAATKKRTSVSAVGSATGILTLAPNLPLRKVLPIRPCPSAACLSASIRPVAAARPPSYVHGPSSTHHYPVSRKIMFCFLWISEWHRQHCSSIINPPGTYVDAI